MDLQLRSTDIARTRFSLENLASLKQQFPTRDNDTLARYLVANDNDASKAVEQLKRAEKLSSEYANVSMNQCVKEIAKGTAYVHGFDRDGRPLIIVNARLHDPVNRDVKEAVLMTLWWTEQAIARLPPEHSRFTILLDRSNCENDVDTEYMKLLSTIFLDLHPERLHRAIVYPAGIVFYSMWNLLLKWFMAETTRNKVLPAVNFEDVTEFIDPMYIPEDLGGECTYKFNINDFDDLHLERGSAKAAQKNAKKEQSTPQHLTTSVPIKGRENSDQGQDADRPELNVLYVNQMSESYGSDQFGPGLGPDVLRSMSADTTVESRDGSTHRAGPLGRRGISEVRTPLGAEPKENPDWTPLSDAVSAAEGVIRPPLHSPKHDATPATPFPYLAPDTPASSHSGAAGSAQKAAPDTPEVPKMAPLSAADDLVVSEEHSPIVTDELAVGSISPLSGDSGHDHLAGGKGDGSPQLSPKVGVFAAGLVPVPEAGPAPVMPSSRPSTAVGSRPPSATASATASAREGTGTGAATEEPLDSIDALGTEGEDVWHEVASLSDDEPGLKDEAEIIIPEPSFKRARGDDDVSLDSCAERLANDEPLTPSVLPPDRLSEPLSEESYHYNAAKRAAAGIVSPPRAGADRSSGRVDKDAVSYISGSRSVSASALAGTNISSPGRKTYAAEVSKPAANPKKEASVVSGPYSVDTSVRSPAPDSVASGVRESAGNPDARRGASVVSGPYSVDTSQPSPFPGPASVASGCNRDAASPVQGDRTANLIEGPPVMPLLESQQQVEAHVPTQVGDRCEVDVDFETEEDGVEGADDGSCWEEVASVQGEGRTTAPRSTLGATGGHSSATIVDATAIHPASVADSTLVAAPSGGMHFTAKVSKAQVASYVQFALSILWCVAVAAAAGVGLYSAYYPFKVQIDVPATLVAQVALLVLLGVCFL